jgi:electron transfer flavoprotein beta subunit
MKAKRKPVDQLTGSDLGLADEDLAPRVRETSWSLPEERPSGRILEGELSTQVKELVRLLREEAKVI